MISNRHLYDAKWQNPFQSAKVITPVLEGKNKPVYTPYSDAGDHVVVINSRHVALLGREWQLRVYFHHPGFNKSFSGGGAKWIPAWQLHGRDPTLVLWKACYNNLNGDLMRKTRMARLHVFPDGEDTVPEDIMVNVSGQLEVPRPVPKRLDEHAEDEVARFPRIWEAPQDYAVK